MKLTEAKMRYSAEVEVHKIDVTADGGNSSCQRPQTKRRSRPQQTGPDDHQGMNPERQRPLPPPKARIAGVIDADTVKRLTRPGSEIQAPRQFAPPGWWDAINEYLQHQQRRPALERKKIPALPPGKGLKPKP